MDYELLANGKIQVGGVAPRFTCNSTKDEINIDENSNNWLVLFSYKEDFDSLATSEMILLEKNRYMFDELHSDIIAMSTGNLLSHFAWINDIYRNTGIKIDFPIIEDTIGEACRKYGMISRIDNSNVVLSNVVIIDENRIIRAILQYSPNIERNIYEILRIIKSVQQK